jgi:PAS domain S-box-containing protein
MGSARCTLEGTIRDADGPFAVLHGFQRHELMGRSVAGLIAPHCRGELPLHLLIVSSRGTHAYPSVHVGRDGSEFPVDVSLELDAGTVRYDVRGAA